MGKDNVTHQHSIWQVGVNEATHKQTEVRTMPFEKKTIRANEKDAPQVNKKRKMYRKKFVQFEKYFRAESPPFLHNSPAQNAAFRLLVASCEANSLSTKGIRA